ncbi:MAG: recombinase family protein, partial [Acidimicrobiales bacterium]
MSTISFASTATGDWTISSLTEALDERCLRTRKTRKFPEKPLERSRVHKMRRSPYYIGVVVWSGQVYPNAKHPPLITPELFDKVQLVLDAHDNGGTKGWRYVHHLKGSVRCFRCKSRLGFMHGRGNGGEYQYFYCLGRQAQNGCDLPYMRVEELELAVAAYQPKIREKLGERVEAIRSELRTYLDTYAERAESDRRAQRRRLEVLDRQEEKLLQQFYDDAISDSLYKKEQQRIRRERSSAEEIIDATQLDPDEIDEAWRVLSHAVDRADD